MAKLDLSCLCLVILANAPAAVAAETPDRFQVLRQAASASLYACETKLKSNAMEVEMHRAGPGQDEVIRRACAGEAEISIQPKMSPVRELVRDKLNAAADLRRWYSAWMASIESLPLDGTAIDETSLNENLRQVIDEADQ